MLRPRFRPAARSLLAAVAGLGAATLPACDRPPDVPPTFTRDVAPIVLAECASCHRPGENAPFPLLTYEDVRRRARQIAEVTQSRYMPPWPPAPGPVPFLRERRLTDEQIATIGRWAAEGAVEGDPADLPPAPTFPTGWRLGPPDLVLEMPEPFDMPAAGPDVYRNFVIESPVPATRHVRTIEFQPGNRRVLHHAFVLTDSTRGSRRQDAADPGPGFDGIHPPESATAPGGFFLSWTPGREPFAGVPGMSWRLEKGTDVVLQLHMQPSGKPEQVRARVGLYFDDAPPTRRPYTVGLFSKDLDIPAGAAAYVVEASYRFPVDVDVLAVLPHAHFLGKSMRGFARRPDGTAQDLVVVPEWDFDWQAAYRFASPVFLPAGTEVGLRYVYDNSTANVRNPNHPPRRVTYGLESTDEMCELWLQVLPRRPGDLDVLKRDYEQVLIAQTAADARRTLAEHPDDAQAHLRLGQSLLAQGKVDHALRRFAAALRADATLADAHLFTGIAHQRRGRTADARGAFTRAIAVRPDDAELHFTLGSLEYMENRLEPASRSYEKAVRLDPDHFRANLQLGVTLARLGYPDLAVPHFRRCVELRPDDPDARRNLEMAQGLLKRK